MAKRRTSPAPDPAAANLSPDQMRAGIKLLNRRLDELRDFDLKQISRSDDPALQKLNRKLEETLVRVFGSDTLEHRRYGHIYLGSVSTGVWEAPSWSQQSAEIKENIEDAIGKFESAVEMLEEQLEDLGMSPAGRAIGLLKDSELHPEIARAATKRFEDGHYADAVEAACKVLNSLVQMRSQNFDDDGRKLMQSVFSKDKGVLLFNDLSNDHERGEQEGMMFLYAGAMAALRNPRAHKIVDDDPDKAHECLAFISFLAKMLDEARRVD